MNDAAAVPVLARAAIERAFRTHDGVDLFYRHWPAPEAPARGAVLLFHRGHEHSGRMAHLVDELGMAEFDFFAWDARGHGHSPGARGDAPGIDTLVRDIDTFTTHLDAEHGFGHEDLALVAQSVGAVLAAAWVHDYAPRIRCMVLASPAFDVKLYVPLARPGLALMHRLRGNFFVTSYVKARYLTRDPERMASYDSDPLIARAISVRVLLGLHDTAKRIVDDAPAIVTPTQLLISGADWVVKHGPQHAFFDRLGTADKERHVLHGFYHDTLGELDRARAVTRVRDFLLRHFDAPIARPDLTNADRAGFTREECDALAAPLPALSSRGLYWRATRAGLAIGAHLSTGVRLGMQTGFDSGSTLDYVYRNTANGVTPLGRMIDRTYLGSIGWTGIRQRKVHLEELLRMAIADRRAVGAHVRILDIAAGHGRYVLDAITRDRAFPDAILLRDYSPRNVEEGRALIAARGLADIATFEQADAFDRANLATIAPRPTIGIVSGLYELFPDNAPVRASLAGLADAIDTGGLLLYTGQPWHPQLELIARGLTSHRGGAWVMRRRTQAELDQLVAAAGFRKIAQRIDRWGIFTVSLAQRTAR